MVTGFESRNWSGPGKRHMCHPDDAERSVTTALTPQMADPASDCAHMVWFKGMIGSASALNRQRLHE